MQTFPAEAYDQLSDSPEISLETILSLRESAMRILDHNDRGLFITPSDELYGAGNNNWGYLWDTAFATMAIAKYDPERAAKLLTNFISTQHANGRIPHMAMWSSDFPIGSLATNVNWHAWRFKQTDSRGNTVKTSPITQPPILAMAASEIINALPGDSRRHDFARFVAPRLMNYHAWLYRERESRNTGLVATIHPHETGRDDAPSHLDLLDAMPLSTRQKLWLTKPMQRLIAANRTDKSANPDERSDTDTVMRAAALAIFGLPQAYRADGKIPANYPYQHLDPGFNAILDRANDALREIAAIGEVSIESELHDSMQRTNAGLQRLWDPKARAFRGLDVNERIDFPAGQEIGDLLPIMSQHITPEQQDAIIDQLIDPEQFGGVSLPSVNRSSDRYYSKMFWRGSNWPHILESFMKALYETGNTRGHPVATQLGKSALYQATDGEFPEYRDGTTGVALGARKFTWAASQTLYVIDRLSNNLDANTEGEYVA